VSQQILEWRLGRRAAAAEPALHAFIEAQKL